MSISDLVLEYCPKVSYDALCEPVSGHDMIALRVADRVNDAIFTTDTDMHLPGLRTIVASTYHEAIGGFLDYIEDGHSGICYINLLQLDSKSRSNYDHKHIMDCIEGLEAMGLWWVYVDSLNVSDYVHPYHRSLLRFRWIVRDDTILVLGSAV